MPRDPSSLPPVLDMEWTHKSKTCRFRPSPFTVREEMANWLRQVGRHYDKRPVIYTTVDFYKDNELWNVKGYDFWLRSTAGHPAKLSRPALDLLAIHRHRRSSRASPAIPTSTSSRDLVGSVAAMDGEEYALSRT